MLYTLQRFSLLLFYCRFRETRTPPTSKYTLSVGFLKISDSMSTLELYYDSVQDGFPT